MSRHFNYELDERRIKLLLKSNAMPYKEDVWSEYVEKTKPLVKVNKIPNIKTTVPIAINKGVVLTVAFVILIFSFTFVIAKFVDFSGTVKNENKSRALVPEADNFKTTELQKVVEPKKEAEQKVAIVSADSTAINTATTQTIIVATPTVNTTNYTSVNTNTTNNSQQITSARIIPDSVNKNTGDTTASNTTKINSKKKKKTVEALETKPLTTELTIPAEEPELELR